METRELVREVPGKGRREGERRVKRRQRRKRRRRFRGNGGWKQTLLEICITTPRGGQRRWVAGGERERRG